MTYRIRPARADDVRAIAALRAPMEGEVLLHHDLVALFERVPEFMVAEDSVGRIVGAGGLHVMWEVLAEIRSLIVDASVRGQGVGNLLVAALVERARDFGIKRIFCLTFEVGFFEKHGFETISDVPVDEETFAEMVRSNDDGVAEFLDLARVKQNTLGNTRMLRLL